MCTREADYFRDYKRLGAIAQLATSYMDDLPEKRPFQDSLRG
jgi:hypothetical protein